MYTNIYEVEWFKEKSITIAVFLVPRGVEKERFRQSASTHSGVGEKETLNINAVVRMVKTVLNASKT